MAEKLGKVFNQAHMIGLSSLLIIRFSTLVFSAFNFNNFHEIIDGFCSIDDLMNKHFKAETDDFTRKVRKAYVKYCAIFLIILTLQATVLWMLPKPGRFNWIVVTMTLHQIQVKDLSFLYFADSINQRLETLLSVPSDDNVLKVHTKLFELSNSINKAYGKSMILHLFKHCIGFSFSLFWAFLNLRFSTPFAEIYRKIYNVDIANYGY